MGLIQIWFYICFQAFQQVESLQQALYSRKYLKFPAEPAAGPGSVLAGFGPAGADYWGVAALQKMSDSPQEPPQKAQPLIIIFFVHPSSLLSYLLQNTYDKENSMVSG